MMRDELDDLLDRWRRPDGSYPSDVYGLVEMVRQYRLKVAALEELREQLLEAFGGDDVAAIRRAFDKGMDALTELDEIKQRSRMTPEDLMDLREARHD